MIMAAGDASTASRKRSSPCVLVGMVSPHSSLLRLLRPQGSREPPDVIKSSHSYGQMIPSDDRRNRHAHAQTLPSYVDRGRSRRRFSFRARFGQREGRIAAGSRPRTGRRRTGRRLPGLDRGSDQQASGRAGARSQHAAAERRQVPARLARDAGVEPAAGVRPDDLDRPAGARRSLRAGADKVFVKPDSADALSAIAAEIVQRGMAFAQSRS